MRQLRSKLAALTKKMQHHRLFFVLAGVILAGGIFGTHAAFAQDNALYDGFLSMLAWVAEWSVATVTQLFIMCIGMLVSVIQYNGFGESAIIDLGWPIVRDALNMLVVLGLLFVAIKNLLPGQGNPAALQQRLVPLFLGIVLMNFSRTISLLLIDASQVIMLTFTNAVKSIAAGNLIEMFNAQNLLVINASNESLAGAAAGAGNLLVATLAKFVLVTIMLVGVATILIAFMLRIVVLWILIILSPAAFLAWGFGQAGIGALGRVWSEWSKNFFGLLAFGPILMFFFWLALSISSGGDIASKESFATVNFDSASALIEGLQGTSVMSTLLALVILLIGVRASAQAMQSFGGLAQWATGSIEGTAKGVLKNRAVQAIGTGGASELGRAGYRGARNVVTSDRVLGGLKTTSDSLTRRASEFQRSRRDTSLIGRFSPTGAIAGAVAGAAGAASGKLGGYQDERQREAQKTLSGLTKEQRKQRYLNLAQEAEIRQNLDGKPLAGVREWIATGGSPEEMAQRREDAVALATDKDARKALKKAQPEQYEAIMRGVFEQVDTDGFLDYIEDEGKKKRVKEDMVKAKAENLQLLSEKDRAEILEEDIVKKSKGSMIGEDAMKSAAVQASLRSTAAGFDQNGEAITYEEYIRNGAAGVDRKRLSEMGYVKVEDIVQDGVVQQDKLSTDAELRDRQVQMAIESGEVKLDKIDAGFADEFAQPIAAALTNKPLSLDASQLPDDSFVRDDIVEGVNSRIAELEAERDNRQNKVVQIQQNIDSLDERIRTGKSDDVEKDMNKLENQRRRLKNAERRTEEAAGRVDTAKRAQYQLVENGTPYFQEGYYPSRVSGVEPTPSADGSVSPTGELNPRDREVAVDFYLSQPSEARRLDVDAIQVDSDMADALANAMKRGMKSLESTVISTIRSGDKAQKENMREALARFEAAVNAEDGATLDTDQATEFRQKITTYMGQLS
jgi:hypothetical protein